MTILKRTTLPWAPFAIATTRPAGIGVDAMKGIEAPVVGGLYMSFQELLVDPPIYFLWKRPNEVKNVAPHEVSALQPELVGDVNVIG